ncbi:CpsD/CapB family tyrosine-protein kinase [Adlercreutzia sp. ZJ154]|uniref:CpsD/CapB family tyrosine-protein kinase n=1 Tax=Adlercreutzia sp. ZJ154 TaxID=2709790 RepID=UPI00197FD02D|nr:CpsD/CapB family tyrosine-protein kinase [Adlercreutzia sp. ZJ154]
MGKKNRKKIGQFEISGLRNAAKTLLANVRFSSVDEPVKTIVVTSSTPDEGKSTVSSNLACAMASSGRRVLIMDCDMRRRSLGAMLDLHPKNGIYAVISGSVSIDSAISATKYKNLFFMDGEPNIPSPPDILSTRRFDALLESLRERFDYVIIDTPPLGAFVDAAIISSLADGVLLVVRQNSTKKKAINDSIQQLRAANARILGAVMTFTKDAESDYYYAYYNQEGKRVNKSKMEQQPLATASRDLVSDDIDVWARKAGISSKDSNPRKKRASGGKRGGGGGGGAGGDRGGGDRSAGDRGGGKQSADNRAANRRAYEPEFDAVSQGSDGYDSEQIPPQRGSVNSNPFPPGAFRPPGSVPGSKNPRLRMRR